MKDKEIEKLNESLKIEIHALSDRYWRLYNDFLNLLSYLGLEVKEIPESRTIQKKDINKWTRS